MPRFSVKKLHGVQFYQKTVLAELHLNHPEIVRMKALARLNVWWLTLDSDIEQIVRDCEVCQTTHGKAPLTSDKPWIWPHRAWQRVHVDYCGPLDGKSFLVIVDPKSKWIEVVLIILSMPSTTAKQQYKPCVLYFPPMAFLRKLYLIMALNSLPRSS